jgi:hypothetical protein
MNASLIPSRRLWWLGAGFAVWCSALVILYALHAIGCAFAWSSGPLRLALAAVLLVHLIVIGWMWRNFAAARPNPDLGENSIFLHEVVLWTLVAAFVAAVLAFAPSLLLTACV